MAHQKTCDNCHEAFESRRSDARFCTSACKAEFHRNGGPRPLPSVTVRNRPSDEQAINADTITAAIEKLTTEIINLKALVISGQTSHLHDGEKKSGFTPTETTTFQKPIDPPTVIFDEEAAKRRTIENTLKSIAALDDF